ncbi:MAG TPA: hypothetical protein VD788_01900, partial [Candidatus Polarisedimenticolaceae bacterium]|nr:hypothetical protein [Candidatus Polarisedimenticolaceae bacterium]
SLRDYGARLEFEPGSLERIEARRAALARLMLRYGADERAVLDARAAAARELEAIAAHDDRVARAAERLREAERDYAACAVELGQRRRTAAGALGAAVEKQLTALALGRARFSVGVTAANGEAVEVAGFGALVFHPRGAERAEFRLAANPGEPERPLHKVASGGELSRVMLGLHAAVDGAGEDRVLIFDEIDSGVGGRVADAVGARLASLARRGQVLCVTHLPQVAVYADAHFSVRKWVEGDRTHTAVERLAPERRIEELARMLGGKRATDASRRHAAELLDGAGRGGAGRAPRGRA